MGKKTFRATMHMTHDNTEAQAHVAIDRLLTGTKGACTEACQAILAISNSKIPVDTGTLQSSGFYEVKRRTDVSSYLYQGIVGYGGNGDPVNPKTGERASQYMVEVHEDLFMNHPNGGEAKFLEKAVQEYAENFFPNTVLKYAKQALAPMSN